MTVPRMPEKRTVLFAPAKFANDLKGRFYNCVAKSLAIQFHTLRLVMGTASGTERGSSFPCLGACHLHSIHSLARTAAPIIEWSKSKQGLRRTIER